MTQDDLEPFLAVVVAIEQAYRARKYGVPDDSSSESPTAEHLEDLFRLMCDARNAYNAMAAQHGLKGCGEVLAAPSTAEDETEDPF